MPKASVVISAYNAEKFIAETLESVMSQSFTDFECIVVDDGSTDKTADIIKCYPDSRIKYLWRENSGGPAAPRNMGLKNATGEYIFIFDADDIMLPQKIELSVKALDDNPTADILFTNYMSIDEQGAVLNPHYLEHYDTLWQLIGGRKNNDTIVTIPSENLYSALIGVNFIGTSSVVLRKSALCHIDEFNEDLKNSDDRLFWILFSKNHHGLFIDKILHKYRVQSSGISNQGFLRRGPSKIKALEIIRSDCGEVSLKSSIEKQLSENYASMAYAYKHLGDVNNQSIYAKKSLAIELNYRALKLYIHAKIRRLIGR